ncbi:helix-turn-helix domain-containing protein [Parabacteroides sp. 52]|uniref:helix-turn-helix domain-containing protein n=1 Tax=unclassified Parabacteroides TaxID=2649774 RepID=UPI0013D7B480|nr:MULTISPECIES: helix-turn-helix domain-containing protein [unclassified Parabacteroides]MDH6535217.1 AraC-like DNA-binding protein [Parabacteroides sp. PM5-20]NDV55643.1 helix-turn-helix domain-containing protein [Parabacteroides sp. 52]
MKNELCSGQHIGCHMNESEERPLIEVVNHKINDCWEEVISHTELIFVFEGSLYVSFDFHKNEKVGNGKIVLLPSGCHFQAKTKEGVSFLVMRLQESIRFCDTFSIENLLKEEVKTDKLPSIPMRPVVQKFLSGLILHMEDGIHCQQYMELKIKEIFFLFRAYYLKKELAHLFYPVIGIGGEFADFVLKNYSRVKTVNEFATLYTCSLSNFDKKFKKSFGVSAYQWMTKKKVELISHDIRTTNKTCRQIAEERGFQSLPQFTDYCKKHLGAAPSKIRNRVVQEGGRTVND